MKRSLWLIFAALALIAAAVSFRLQPEALTQAAPVIERLPDVRVQHEYVTVPVSATGDNLKVKERSRLAQTRTMPDPLSATPTLDAETVKAEPVAIRKPAASRASNRASGDETLFAKARRAFMGDGRHRPEPFPRPRGNN